MHLLLNLQTTNFPLFSNLAFNMVSVSFVVSSRVFGRFLSENNIQSLAENVFSPLVSLQHL